MDNEKITIKYLGHAFFKVQVNDKIVTFDPVDPKTGKPTRVGRKLNAEGVRVRYAKKSGEEI